MLHRLLLVFLYAAVISIVGIRSTPELTELRVVDVSFVPPIDIKSLDPNFQGLPDGGEFFKVTFELDPVPEKLTPAMLEDINPIFDVTCGDGKRRSHAMFNVPGYPWRTFKKDGSPNTFFVLMQAMYLTQGPDFDPPYVVPYNLLSPWSGPVCLRLQWEAAGFRGRQDTTATTYISKERIKRAALDWTKTLVKLCREGVFCGYK